MTLRLVRANLARLGGFPKSWAAWTSHGGVESGSPFLLGQANLRFRAKSLRHRCFSAVLRHNAHGRAEARSMASFEVTASALVMKLIGPPMVMAASC